MRKKILASAIAAASIDSDAQRRLIERRMRGRRFVTRSEKERRKENVLTYNF